MEPNLKLKNLNQMIPKQVSKNFDESLIALGFSLSNFSTQKKSTKVKNRRRRLNSY